MPSPSFTWEEIAQHNKPDDCFVAVRGKVYDVSKFVETHPGGRDQLILGAGRDVTQIFENYHKESTVEFLSKFYVGELATNELPTFPPKSDFFKTLAARINEHFVKTGQDPKNAPWMFVRYFFIVSAYIAAAALQIKYQENLFLCLLLSVVIGCAGALLGLMPLHDSSHFAITHNPLVWKILGYFHDFVNGASNRVWAYQHMLGHHTYTNIDTADPDIITASPELPDIRRIKPYQKYFNFYVYQFLYMPVLYSVLAWKTRLQDLYIVFILRRNASIRLNQLPPHDVHVLIISKVLFVFYRIVLPQLLGMSLVQSVLLLVVADIVSSQYLALVFQVSHVVREVKWPLPDKNNKMEIDWAEMQIQTTVDYATASWFWNVFSGALNHQTVHHLFPNINQFYYPQITPILVATCKDFGIPYNYKNSYWEALSSHILHLRDLGIAPHHHHE